LGLSGLIIRYLDHTYADTVEHRYAAQLFCMELNPQALLLDVGCKEGINTLRLGDAIGTRRLLGLECNLRTLRQAAHRRIDPIVGDANRPLPLKDESVDVVTATDVLEHLVDPQMLVRETYRVLKPGGYAMFATPNLASWHNIFALLIGLQPFSGPNVTTMLDAEVGMVRRVHRRAYGLPEDGPIDDPTDPAELRHIVVIAYRSLLRLMERQGFQVEYARGFGYYPLPPLLARLLARIDPWHAHHVVVKARKQAMG